MANLVGRILAKVTVAAAATTPVVTPTAEAATSTANNPNDVRALDANPSYPPIPRAELKRLVENPGPAEENCSYSPPIYLPTHIQPAGPPMSFQTYNATGLDPDPSVTYSHNVAGAVSPDGKTIAATVWKSGVQFIDVATKAATVGYKYENSRERVQQLKWSPDGLKVAFVVFETKSDPDGLKPDSFEKCRLIVRDRAGKGLVDQPIAGCGQVAWTKDGKGVVTALSETIPKSDPPAAQVRCFGIEVASGKRTWEWRTTSGKNPTDVREVILSENDTKVAVAHVDVTQRSHKLTTVDVKTGTAKTSSLPAKYMDAGSDRTPQSSLGVPAAQLVEFKGGRVIYFPESSHGRGFDIQSNVNSPFNDFRGRQGTSRSPDGTRLVTFRRDETFGAIGQVWVFDTTDGTPRTLPREVIGKGRFLGVSWTGNDSVVVLMAPTSDEKSESLMLFRFNVK